MPPLIQVKIDREKAASFVVHLAAGEPIPPVRSKDDLFVLAGACLALLGSNRMGSEIEGVAQMHADHQQESEAWFRGNMYAGVQFAAEVVRLCVRGDAAGLVSPVVSARVQPTLDVSYEGFEVKGLNADAIKKLGEDILA